MLTKHSWLQARRSQALIVARSGESTLTQPRGMGSRARARLRVPPSRPDRRLPASSLKDTDTLQPAGRCPCTPHRKPHSSPSSRSSRSTRRYSPPARCSAWSSPSPQRTVAADLAIGSGAADGKRQKQRQEGRKGGINPRGRHQRVVGPTTRGSKGVIASWAPARTGPSAARRRRRQVRQTTTGKEGG